MYGKESRNGKGKRWNKSHDVYWLNNEFVTIYEMIKHKNEGKVEI